MGSMESLSSHSSEQNSSCKTASSAQVKDKSLLDLRRTPSQLSNGPRSASTCVSSPESSSREDAARTDGESEDALSLSSVSTAPRLSPAPKKAPHCRTDLKPALLNRSSAPSLKSLHVSEGTRCENKPHQSVISWMDFINVTVLFNIHTTSISLECNLPRGVKVLVRFPESELCHYHLYGDRSYYLYVSAPLKAAGAALDLSKVCQHWSSKPSTQTFHPNK